MKINPKYQLAVVFLCLYSAGAFCAEFSRALDEAVFAAREGRYQKSEMLFGRLLKKNNNDPRALSDYAVILSWQEKNEEAVKQFEKLPETFIPPSYVIPNIARSYRFLKNYSRALELYSSHLKIYPREKEAVKGYVYTFFDMEEFNKAADYLEKRLEEKNLSPEISSLLKGLYGEALIKKQNIQKAEEYLKSAVAADKNNVYANIALARLYMSKNELEEAENVLKYLEHKFSANFDFLDAKGNLIEARKDFINAYIHYDRLSNRFPKNDFALNAKFQSLINLGCNSLAYEMLQTHKNRIEPGISRQLTLLRIIAFIEWNDPDSALELIIRSIAYTPLEERIHNNNYYNELLFFKIAALKLKGASKDIVYDFENLEKNRVQIPNFVKEIAAEAYLDLKKPKKALALYKKVYDSPAGFTLFDSKMGLYQTYVDLGCYKKSKNILDEMALERPDMIIKRGVFMDNDDKTEALINYGWLYASQDKLQPGQKYLTGLLEIAPFNTHIRTGLAHTYMWRGWSRKALEEFAIAHSINPQDSTNAVGYAYSLYENDRVKESKKIIEQVKKDNPLNKHTGNFEKFSRLDRLRTLSVLMSKENESPGAVENLLDIRLNQPILPFRSIYAKYVYKKIYDDNSARYIKRGGLGIDWRLFRDLYVFGEITIAERREYYGYMAGTSIFLSDKLSLYGYFNSYSISIPLSSGLRQPDASEIHGSIMYRSSELFEAQAGITQLRYSDDNRGTTFFARADNSIWRSAYWKLRLETSGSATDNSRTDVSYFSPEKHYDAFLTPYLEHVLYKRYDTSVYHTLFYGNGAVWEKSYDPRHSWFLRYEFNMQLNEYLRFTIGDSYSRKIYSGERTDVWKFYGNITTRF